MDNIQNENPFEKIHENVESMKKENNVKVYPSFADNDKIKLDYWQKRGVDLGYKIGFEKRDERFIYKYDNNGLLTKIEEINGNISFDCIRDNMGKIVEITSYNKKDGSVYKWDSHGNIKK